MNTKNYNEIITDLSNNLNNKLNIENFKTCFLDLKKLYGVEISTHFLRNLVLNSDLKIKTNRVYYCLSLCNLKTKKVYDYGVLNNPKVANVDIIEYARKKSDNSIFIKNIRSQEVLKDNKVYTIKTFFMIQA